MKFKIGDKVTVVTYDGAAPDAKYPGVYTIESVGQVHGEPCAWLAEISDCRERIRMMSSLRLVGDKSNKKEVTTMTPKLYTKIPVQVEAIEFVYNEEGFRALKEFCGASLGDVRKARHPGAKGEAEIKTLEDGKELKVKHIATEGDFIVKGIAGEFWAVKPEIFKQTYKASGES